MKIRGLRIQIRKVKSRALPFMHIWPAALGRQGMKVKEEPFFLQ